MAPTPRPWNRVGVRAERDFRIFTARTLDVTDPRDGAPYVRTVIDAPDWINVVALTSDDEAVLVRQFRFGTWSNTLEIPGGMVDPGEAPDVAAARELEEETGYRAERMIDLGRFHASPGMSSEGFTLVRAEGLTRVGEGGGVEGEEIIVHRVPLGEIAGFVARKRAQGVAMDVKLLLLLGSGMLAEQFVSQAPQVRSG